MTKELIEKIQSHIDAARFELDELDRILRDERPPFFPRTEEPKNDN